MKLPACYSAARLTLCVLPWLAQSLVHAVPAFSTSVFDTAQVQLEASTTLPTLDILLSPLFDSDNLTAIHVVLRFAPSSSVGPSSRDLLYGTPTIFSTPGLDVSPNTLKAFDGIGSLKLTSRNVTEGDTVAQYWSTDRRVEGPVEVSYTSLPRYVDAMTRSGPAMDFRLASRGFTSSGFAMLLVPANTDVSYSVRLAWDLQAAPAGTKGVWTFGEHIRTVTRVLTPSNILATYFGAGPLHAFREESDDVGEENRFNVYWFGEPPFDAVDVSQSLSDMFERMSAFFEDEADVYRVFLRHNPYAGTNTGTALQRSFIMGYDDSDYAHPPAAVDKLTTLAHEMVHNWILWDDETDMTIENWYPEGMAEYYCLLFMYQLDIVSKEKYIEGVNDRLSAYYTNQYVNASMAETAKHTWETTGAQRLPYRRGFTLALILDDLIYQATKGASTLDDVVCE